MNRRIKSLVSLILILYFLVGCATLGINIKPYSEMTPKEKMIVLFSLYNKQYEDYKLQASRTNITEPEKQVLRDRKQIMIRVYPLIQALDIAVVEGRPFDAS